MDGTHILNDFRYGRISGRIGKGLKNHGNGFNVLVIKTKPGAMP
jgi:hypothetical protein